MKRWVYRAVVNGRVVFEREVGPGESHEDAWVAVNQEFHDARGWTTISQRQGARDA